MRRLLPMVLVLALARGAAAQDGSTASGDADTGEAALPTAAVAPMPAPVRTTTPLDEIPADRRPTVKSWIEGDGKVALGGTVTMKVHISHLPGDQIHLPADTSFGGLDLVDRSVEQVEGPDGWVVDRYTMTLIALSPGTVTVPTLSFGGVLERGEAVRIETPPRSIVVTDPTEGAESDEPRPLSPVVDVYQDDYTLLWVLGSLAAIALIVLLVRYMVKNWDRWHPRGPLAPPPPRPPERVALEKLDALREAGLPVAGSKKSWYIELSEIMREYVGGRYDFDGLESTTEEIIHVMRGKKTAGLTQAELYSFLNGCDMVKFARYEPTEAEDGEALDEAYRIVKVTTPHILPPAPPADRGGPGGAP